MKAVRHIFKILVISLMSFIVIFGWHDCRYKTDISEFIDESLLKIELLMNIRVVLTVLLDESGRGKALMFNVAHILIFVIYRFTDNKKFVNKE